MIQQMMPGQKAATKRAEDLRDLNLRVMRFSDEYAGRVREVMTTFQLTAGPQERLTAQNWKVQQVESAYTIASGPSPITNALDMVVLATLSRFVLDDLWVTELYGARARPAQEVHRKLEAEAWVLISTMLTESQSEELRGLIERWRVDNPRVRALAYVHFNDFAKSIGSPRPGESQAPDNLFALLGLDPFTQLDPAVQEIAQSRELAERAIFYMQRTPRLLDLQIERITYQLAAMPETRTLLGDLDRASLIGTAADRLVTSLPDLLATEREALISQLMQELQERSGALGAWSADLRSTLEAGTQTADSLHATLETLDRISARYPPRPATADAAGRSRPFDITEYTQMVRELAQTTRELNALAQNVDSALPAVRGATQEAATQLEQVLDRVFVQLLVIVLVAIAGTLVAALVYRAAVLRLQRGRPTPR